MLGKCPQMGSAPGLGRNTAGSYTLINVLLSAGLFCKIVLMVRRTEQLCIIPLQTPSERSLLDILCCLKCHLIHTLIRKKKNGGFIFSSNSMGTANQQVQCFLQPFLGYRVYMLAKLLKVTGYWVQTMKVLQDSRPERFSVHNVRSRQCEGLISGPRTQVSTMMMVVLVIKQEGGAHLSSQHREGRDSLVAGACWPARLTQSVSFNTNKRLSPRKT